MTAVPLITYAIRHFNTARYVEGALRAAFAQTYQPLEILFIDDNSSDDGFAIASRLAQSYGGPHRIRLVRNEVNVGCGGQTMRIRDLMRGDIVVFADADDLSVPERCALLQQKFADPNVFGAISDFDFIDDRGAPIDNALDHFGGIHTRAETWTSLTLARGQGATVGAVLALRREVLDRGIALDHLRRGDDLVSGFRATLLGGVASVPEVLVHRRVHPANVSMGIGLDRAPAKLKKWHAKLMGEAVLIPISMGRDLAMLVEEGQVSEAVAEPVRAALAIEERRLKLLHVVHRQSALLGWTYLRALGRCGVAWRDGVRMLLPAIAPRLELLRKRRLASLRQSTTQAALEQVASMVSGTNRTI